MEPFVHRIRGDPTIKGISLPGTLKDVKTSQYADDTNVFVTYNSVRNILMLVELYELVSGAKLNEQKTFGTWLGKWKGRQDQPFGLNWSTEVKKLYVSIWDLKILKILLGQKFFQHFQKTVNFFSRRYWPFKGILYITFLKMEG